MTKNILTGPATAKIMKRYIKQIEADSSFELYVSLMPIVSSGTEKVFENLFGADKGPSAYESFIDYLKDIEDYGGEMKQRIHDIKNGLNTLEKINTKRLDIVYLEYSTKTLHVHIMFYKDGANIELGTSLKNEIKESEDISGASIVEGDKTSAINTHYDYFESAGLTVITDPILETIKREYPETYIAF